MRTPSGRAMYHFVCLSFINTRSIFLWRLRRRIICLKMSTRPNNWDASKSLKLLNNCCHRVKESEATNRFEPAVNQLKYLANEFFSKAANPQYRSYLNSDERVELENLFGDLADWFHQDSPWSPIKQNHTATFQVSLWHY